MHIIRHPPPIFQWLETTIDHAKFAPQHIHRTSNLASRRAIGAPATMLSGNGADWINQNHHQYERANSMRLAQRPKRGVDARQPG